MEKYEKEEQLDNGNIYTYIKGDHRIHMINNNKYRLIAEIDSQNIVNEEELSLLIKNLSLPILGDDLDKLLNIITGNYILKNRTESLFLNLLATEKGEDRVYRSLITINDNYINIFEKEKKFKLNITGDLNGNLIYYIYKEEVENYFCDCRYLKNPDGKIRGRIECSNNDIVKEYSETSEHINNVYRKVLGNISNL